MAPKQIDLIARLTSDKRGYGKCLAHYVHEYNDIIVWAVWERDGKRIITCDLLEHNGGFKAMDESWHPYYYSCPLAFLDMAPIVNNQWRDNVKMNHKQGFSKTIGPHVGKIVNHI